MNERIYESLSVLLDGEADELEIRRLLNQTEHDDALLEKWASYQMIGAIMRQEPVTHLDLAKGVRQALDGEPMDNVQPFPMMAKAKNNHWRLFAASGAVAASVMVAVLVGVQWQQGVTGDLQNMPAIAAAQSANHSVVEPSAVLIAMDEQQQHQLEEAQRKLQEYVLQHNEQNVGNDTSSMMPFMQTVKFNQVEARH